MPESRLASVQDVDAQRRQLGGRDRLEWTVDRFPDVRLDRRDVPGERPGLIAANEPIGVRQDLADGSAVCQYQVHFYPFRWCEVWCEQERARAAHEGQTLVAAGDRRVELGVNDAPGRVESVDHHRRTAGDDGADVDAGMTWPAGVAQWFAAPEEHLVEDEPRLVDRELDCRFVELARRAVESDVHTKRVVGRPRQPAAVVFVRHDSYEHVALPDL